MSEQTLHGRARLAPLGWALILDRYRETIPAFPDTEALRPARLPNAPRLHETMTDGALMSALVVTYRTCTGVRNPNLSKFWSSIGAGGLLLEAHDIAPAEWVAFSVAAWKRMEVTNSLMAMPAIAWVYSSKRIEERLEWYREDQGNWCAPRLLFCEEAHALLRAWQRMRAALLLDLDRTHASVQSIVAKFNKAQTELLPKILHRHSVMQENINRRVAAWEYVW